jgi:hypothetical protein
MAASVSLTLSGSVTSAPEGTLTVSQAFTSATGVGQTSQVTIATGAGGSALTIPSLPNAPTSVLIQVVAVASGAVYIAGNSTDSATVGVNLGGAGGFAWLSLGTSPTIQVFTSSATATLQVTWF